MTEEVILVPPGGKTCYEAKDLTLPSPPALLRIDVENLERLPIPAHASPRSHP